ncbi:hypothetical protein A9Q94_06495 [Rhodobacterales bacterium 56_14_T64]|nr:hypothetical protein A9Q94_06495 [Rhodobacterales bacterium 56_14_T64]
MLDYLVSREQDEMFRTSVRDIDFPDGEIRRIETYRLVWQWYDRAGEYEFGPGKEWLLNIVLKCAVEESISVSESFGRVLNHVVKTDEAAGLDYTDDKLELLVAKQAMGRFYERKKKRL